MNGIPTRAGYPGSGGINVVFRRQCLVQLVGIPQGTYLGRIQIPGTGDIVKQVFEQRFRRWLLKDIRMLIGQSADFTVQLPEQGFYGCVHRIDVCLQCFHERTGRFPEFATGRFLAQTDQSLQHLLHVLEMGIEIRFTDDAGQRKLVHLAQFADVAQNCRVLQALGYLAGHGDSRGGQVRFEQ